MNYKAVLNVIFRILLVEAAAMLLPVVVALCYRENPVSFLIPIAVMAVVGGAGMRICKSTGKIYSREGFVIVAMSWLILSLAGCLPFILSGELPRFADAFFETVSGFSTTGATIVSDIEGMSQSLLFWRSFTHWLGGMGVLVFVMAIMPMTGIRSVHLMRAEVPGPTKSKLVPKMKSTATILYGIYVGMTVIELILLLCGGMSFFDALIHAFGTAGTGGFSNKALSIAAYQSPYIETVIGVFMLLFGINFNLYYFILIGNFRSILKSEELRAYLCIVAAAIAVLTINTLHLFSNFTDGLRTAFFQVGAIISSTGFSTADFTQWPALSQAVIVCLMIVGACAGSTGGGMKVSRIVIICKSMVHEIKRLLHPRAVQVMRLDGETLDEAAAHGTLVYCTTYFCLTVVITLLVTAGGHEILTGFTAAVTCLSNIGPGLGPIGPMGSFNIFSEPIKLLLSFAMLFGRLEIFPMLMLFLPSTWRRT